MTEEANSPLEHSRALGTFQRRQLPTKPEQGTPLRQCPTNLDLDSPRGKAMMFRASGDSDYKVTEENPVRLTVIKWAMLPETRVDAKTGEVSEFVSVCLWDVSGKLFKSAGVASPRRLFALLYLYSDQEWEQGIPIIVYARPRPGRAPMHSIEIDVERL